MVKYERRMLVLIYMLAIAMFTNAAMIGEKFDIMILLIGIVMCVGLGAVHYILTKFRPDNDKFIILFSGVLSIVSIVVLYRLRVTKNVGDVYLKQLIFIILGFAVLAAIVIYMPDVKKLAKFKKLYLIITLALMPMALVVSKLLGQEAINGSYNWVRLGPLSFQPSEIAKITLVLYLACALMEYEDNHSILDDIKQLFMPGIVLVISVLFMVAQRDLGTALMFFAIALAMIYATTGKKLYVLVALGALVVGGTLAYFLFSHMRVRVDIWINPWSDPDGPGYQLVQGFFAIAAGGLTGVGLGKGYPDFIPERHTDFIYTVICEELGIIFAVGLMLIYFLLFYKGIRTAFLTRDRFSQLACLGLSVLVACQTFVIVGGLFKVIPLTGITLPIISYGGTSVLTMFIVLGLLQKISEEV